jgi:Transglycosylase SLT domain
VDAQDDKKRDLWQDWGDVFASIANYFREHGWETGAPVMAEVDLDPEPTFVMDTRNLTLNETLGSLAAQGVEAREALPSGTPAMLVFAEQSDGPAYRIGLNNFWVITRYNRSPRYAMAVHDLAEAIGERVRKIEAEMSSAAPGPGTSVPPPQEATPVAPAASVEPSALPAAPPTSQEATSVAPPANGEPSALPAEPAPSQEASPQPPAEPAPAPASPPADSAAPAEIAPPQEATPPTPEAKP